MDAVTYIQERARMCKASICFYCELSSRGNGTECACSEFVDLFPEKAVAIVEKWSQEHPQKTMLSEFLEKFPNAPLSDDGMPRYTCPYHIGLDERIDILECSSNCVECWNRPLED